MTALTRPFLVLTPYWTDYNWSGEGALKGGQSELFDHRMSSVTGTIDSRELVVHTSPADPCVLVYI